MVSNGPYILTAWEHNQSMVLEQNPNYYGEKADHHPGDYTLFDDHVAQALVPFENDELDQAQVSGADLDRVKDDPTLSAQMQVFPRSGTQLRLLRHAPTRRPTTSASARRSRMAINRETLADGILKGQFTADPDHPAAGHSGLQPGRRARRERRPGEGNSWPTPASPTARDSRS